MASVPANQRRSKQLKDWYLARLRSRAFAGSRDLTPFTLIETDRKFLETLVLNTAHGANAHPEQKDRYHLLTLEQGSVIWLLCVIVSIAVCLVAGNKSSLVSSLYGLTFGILFSSGPPAEFWLSGGIIRLVPLVFYLVPPLLAAASAGKILRTQPKFIVATLMLAACGPIAACCAFFALQRLGAAGQDLFAIVVTATAWQSVLSTWILASLAPDISTGAVLMQKLAQTFVPDENVKVASVSTNLQQTYDNLSNRIRELQNRESLIAETCGELVCCFNEQLQFESANKSCERILEYTPDELTKLTIKDITLPEDCDRFVRSLAKLQSKGETLFFDSRVRSRSGTAVDLRWSADWSESEKCYFACAEDVTHEKRLERAKQEFMAMMDHDIREPVGSVLVSLEAVLEGYCGEVPDSILRTLKRADRGLTGLMQLIMELLEFEKAAVGKINLSIEDVDLAKVVAAAISNIEEIASKKEIKISEQLTAALVPGDGTKLARVFTNLLRASIKLSPQGQEIEVLIHVNEHAVEVRVRDHGPGIAPEYQTLIFQRFERIQPKESAGVGLAMAKAIVEAHDGTIKVENEPDSGSTFIVQLPLKRGDLSDA